MDICRQGVRNLVTGIILQACVDYQEAYTGSRIGVMKPDVAVEDIENFFYSDWFLGMCNIDPEWLIQELRKQCLRHQEQNRRASRYKRLDDIFMEV